MYNALYIIKVFLILRKKLLKRNKILLPEVYFFNICLIQALQLLPILIYIYISFNNLKYIPFENVLSLNFPMFYLKYYN